MSLLWLIKTNIKFNEKSIYEILLSPTIEQTEILFHMSVNNKMLRHTLI